MTTRLYYTDADMLAFDATVVGVLEFEGRPGVVLDRTAFYPTSGGQPHDTGLLAGVPVVDVVDQGDDIVHVLAAPLPEGRSLRGEIDAARRLDHRQQHTGQHILSAAFDRLFASRTLSFHMGTELSSIDLAVAVTPDEVERAVDEANAVVWDNRAVVVRFVSAEEASTMGLRKESTRVGELRLVEVPDFDLSACGGTHVGRTGAVGVIVVTAVEKFKGGLRVTFACGGRAVRALRGLRDAVAGSVRALSVLPGDLPASIQRLQADAKAQRKRLQDLQEALAVHEARRLRASALAGGDGDFVCAAVDGWDPPGLKAIASALLADGAAGTALAGGDPVSVVVGRVRGQAPTADAVVRQLVEAFGGKGGGSPELAQAGGLRGRPDEVVQRARAALRGGSPRGALEG